MINRGVGGGVVEGVKRPRKKPREGRCRNCCKRFTASLSFHVGLCALVVLYSVMGAFTFRALEAPYEDGKAQEVEHLRNDAIREIWKITYKFNILYKENWTQLVSDEIKSFQTELIAAVKDGYDGKEDGGQQWSLPKAFFYSLSLMTTISYGNIAPRTNWGKIATILYAIIGIPLMLLYLINVGDILAKSLRYLYGRLCSCNSRNGSDHNCCKRRRNHSPQNHHSEAVDSNYGVHHIEAHDESSDRLHRSDLEPGLQDKLTGHHDLHHEEKVRIEMTNVDDHLRDGDDDCCDDYSSSRSGGNGGQPVCVPIALGLLILVGYISAGAAIFSLWEGWSFLDGLYFAFVTLSTTGSGDLVIGESLTSDDRANEKLVIWSLYLLAGMALIAMCFHLMLEEVIHKVRNCGRRLVHSFKSHFYKKKKTNKKRVDSSL